MIKLTDIHNHILFGVDDGAKTVDQSLEMIREEYIQGVRTFVFTPHYDEESCKPPKELLLKNFNELKVRCLEELPDVEVYLGSEVLRCNDMVEKLNNGTIMTMAGSRYVLVEYFPSDSQSLIEMNVSALINGGYTPILAHVERYKAFRKKFVGIDKTFIRHLLEMGCLIQVNASTVYRQDKDFVKKLIKNDFLHLIGTDAHAISTRGIHWKKCVDLLQSKYSKDYVDWLLVRNPKKIILDEFI